MNENGDTVENQNDVLQHYLTDYWEHVLEFNPTFATYIGDHRYNDRLEDLSGESLAGQNRFFKILLKKTGKIEAIKLHKENKLNLALIRRSLEDTLQMYDFTLHYLPLDHMRGPHIDFPQIIEYQPFNTLLDFENYIKRLNAFPRLIEQVIENMRSGVKSGMTAFRGVIDHVLKQVIMFTQPVTEKSPLYQPVSGLPEDFTKKDKEDIGRSVKEAITTKVTPAYRELYHYLREEYVQHCRTAEGIWSLPQGTEMYRFLVRYHTTTDLSPEEIHETGRDEVERISKGIEKIMRKISFAGGIREFAAYVKEKKELYAENARELFDGYRDILNDMDKKLPEYFGRLPRARYDLKEIEEYRQQAAPAAYYYSPPMDFTRPGYFYVNTYKPENRPKYEMEALAYHEAVPGHHLQIALMQEMKDVPDFRRYEGATAFIEGWGLYAEKLAKEMGFYRDDFSEYGRLTFEIWRAVRLVVDTGMHCFTWSREQSIEYCREHTGLEEHEIAVEVDRYIAMPGQALAYKIGELKFLALRSAAENMFGPRFDIRRFHDRLLENGALPLRTIENFINDWIKTEAEAEKKE